MQQHKHVTTRVYSTTFTLVKTVYVVFLLNIYAYNYDMFQKDNSKN